MNFPLYELREYIDNYWEGKYKIVSTKKNRYVLDIDLPDKDYLERRMEILRDTKKPYKIYPLNKRIDNYTQLIRSKKREFIDGLGKIKVWKPRKFYQLICLKVSAAWTTDTGKTCIQAGNHKFIIEGPPTNFVQIVDLGDGVALIDTCNEYRELTRKKI